MLAGGRGRFGAGLPVALTPSPSPVEREKGASAQYVKSFLLLFYGMVLALQRRESK
jgi:hypothetical protein